MEDQGDDDEKLNCKPFGVPMSMDQLKYAVPGYETMPGMPITTTPQRVRWRLVPPHVPDVEAHL